MLERNDRTANKDARTLLTFNKQICSVFEGKKKLSWSLPFYVKYVPCQMHFLILLLCWSIWIFKYWFDWQHLLLYCSVQCVQCFCRLSFSSPCYHYVRWVRLKSLHREAKLVSGIIRRCLKSLHCCPWPTPAMLRRCSLLSVFDVLIHAQLWQILSLLSVAWKHIKQQLYQQFYTKSWLRMFWTTSIDFQLISEYQRNSRALEESRN